MANYQYRGRNQEGRLVTGSLDAGNESAAAETLMRRGITPLNLTTVSASQTNKTQPNESIRRLWLQPRVTADDLIVFTRQMYALTKAGIPLLRAIEGLANNTSNARLSKVLLDVVEQLERGRELSTAMASHPRVFPRLLVAIVHVGENTGQLEEAFEQLASYLESEEETRKQIKSALRYPSFIVTAIVIAMVILNIWVVPTFARMFEQFDAELPLTTQILIGTSNFFVNWWPLLLAMVVVAMLAFARYRVTAAGQLRLDTIKVKLPVFGDIVMRSLLSRFGRSFAVMLRAGVPLTQALSLVAEAVDNNWMKLRINDMRRGIERGESLSRVARQSHLFTPLVLQMINVGEETGRVDEMLMEVADYYEREVDYDLKSLTARIEPILLVIVAVMVAIMALGIFTPLWDMMDAYRGR